MGFNFCFYQKVAFFGFKDNENSMNFILNKAWRFQSPLKSYYAQRCVSLWLSRRFARPMADINIDKSDKSTVNFNETWCILHMWWWNIVQTRLRGCQNKTDIEFCFQLTNDGNDCQIRFLSKARTWLATRAVFIPSSTSCNYGDCEQRWTGINS